MPIDITSTTSTAKLAPITNVKPSSFKKTVPIVKRDTLSKKEDNYFPKFENFVKNVKAFFLSLYKGAKKWLLSMLDFFKNALSSPKTDQKTFRQKIEKIEQQKLERQKAKVQVSDKDKLQAKPGAELAKKPVRPLKAMISNLQNEGVRKFKVAQEVQRIEDLKRKAMIAASKSIKSLSPKSSSQDRVFEVIDSCSAFDEKEKNELKACFAKSLQDLLAKMVEKAEEAQEFLERSEITAYERFLKSDPNPGEICSVIMQLSSTTRKHLLQVFRNEQNDQSKTEAQMLVFIRKSNGIKKFNEALEVQIIEDSNRKKIIEASKKIAKLDIETASEAEVLIILDSCSEYPKDRDQFKQIYEKSPKKLPCALRDKAKEVERYLEAMTKDFSKMGFSNVTPEFFTEFEAFSKFVKWWYPTYDEGVEVIEQRSSIFKKIVLVLLREHFQDPSKTEEDLAEFFLPK